MIPEVDLYIAGQFIGGSFVPMFIAFPVLIVVIVLTVLWNRR